MKKVKMKKYGVDWIYAMIPADGWQSGEIEIWRSIGLGHFETTPERFRNYFNRGKTNRSPK